MKTITILSALLVLSGLLHASQNKIPIGPVGPAPSKKVLLIGFDRDGFSSNYFGDEYLSELLSINKDSIGRFYCSLISQKLIAHNCERFHLPEDKSDMQIIHSNLNQNGEKIQNINHDYFVNLLNKYSAGYMLYISRYQLNWSGEPFNTNIHRVSYTLFDYNINVLLSGELFVESDEIAPFRSQKKAGKKVEQLAEKIENTVK